MVSKRKYNLEKIGRLSLTFVLAERARGRIDQSKLKMLQRRLQFSGNLENQAQPQVYFIGPAIDRVNVQELLERFGRPG